MRVIRIRNERLSEALEIMPEGTTFVLISRIMITLGDLENPKKEDASGEPRAITEASPPKAWHGSIPGFGRVLSWMEPMA